MEGWIILAVNLVFNVVILVVGVTIKRTMARGDDIAQIRVHLAKINGTVEEYRQFRKEHNERHVEEAERVRNLFEWCRGVHKDRGNEP